MNRRMIRSAVRRLGPMLSSLLVAAIAGCGGSSYDYAPMSGIVMMNGAPLADATVVFEPIAEDGAEESGPSSSGRTDAGGQFELKLADGTIGAVVGKHRVRIWPQDTAGGTGEGDSVDNDADPNAEAVDGEETDEEEESDVMNYEQEPEDAIPARYNIQSSLTETVPADGNDSLRFDLTR